MVGIELDPFANQTWRLRQNSIHGPGRKIRELNAASHCCHCHVWIMHQNMNICPNNCETWRTSWHFKCFLMLWIFWLDDWDFSKPIGFDQHKANQNSEDTTNLQQLESKHFFIWSCLVISNCAPGPRRIPSSAGCCMTMPGCTSEDLGKWVPREWNPWNGRGWCLQKGPCSRHFQNQTTCKMALSENGAAYSISILSKPSVFLIRHKLEFSPLFPIHTQAPDCWLCM